MHRFFGVLMQQLLVGHSATTPVGLVGSSDLQQNFQPPPICASIAIDAFPIVNTIENTSSAMPITTAEREKRLTEAIDYFHSHNGSIPVRKVAAMYEVDHSTLSRCINGKHGSVRYNDGFNKFLAVAQLGALLLYIRKQALAGFPCI
jgi:hypothetical protein